VLKFSGCFQLAKKPGKKAMKSKESQHEKTNDLFRSELKNILNLRHALCQLSRLVNWERLEETFGEFFPSQVGCPATPTRLVVGLFYLKATFNVSDEMLISRWIENPYWQYFCGEQYLQHELPIDPSSMSRWRKRLDASGVEALLEETIALGLKTETIDKKDLKKAIVDTTVQEKNITYPTDSKLYKKGIDLIVKAAEELELSLKQSYKFVSKKALFKAGCYYRAKQMRRAARETKRLKTYLGRVSRDFKRKLEALPSSVNASSNLLSQVDRLLLQTKESKNKLYSFHAPEVECIGKGKAHKRYEFGVKVGIVTPHKKNFVIGAHALPGNPFDGHTLEKSLDQVERLTGIRPAQTYVDNGYRGHDEKGSDVFVARQAKGRKTATTRRAMKRRSAVEPLIGHLKNDGHLGRNFLKGPEGDHFNAVMSGAGYNLRVILKKLRLFWACYLTAFWRQSTEYLMPSIFIAKSLRF
jgi:IS5 family transposase